VLESLHVCVELSLKESYGSLANNAGPDTFDEQLHNEAMGTDGKPKI